VNRGKREPYRGYLYDRPATAMEGMEDSQLPEEEDLAGVEYQGEDEDAMKIFEELGC
jgi:hypothetical protein